MSEQLLQETVKRARSHLERKEFNEGLAVLEQFTNDDTDVEALRRRLEQTRSEEIDDLLHAVEKARETENWETAFDFIRKAQGLDNDDKKVRSALDRLRDAFASQRNEEEINLKKKSAKNLLNKSSKSIEDLETAIRILEEIIADQPRELDADSMLTDAQRLRSQFLQSKGQIATLEQAGQFEEALKEMNDLIARGFTEYEGRNIYEVQKQLENKAKEFAGMKAAKYLKKAEETFAEDNNPQLAMRYIDMGLELPWISKEHRDTFNDLKVKVGHAVEKFKAVEKEVEQARELMDNQKYEAAISILENAIAKIPRYNEAKTFLDLARDGLKSRIIKEAGIEIARVESKLTMRNFETARENLLGVLDKLTVTGDEADSLRIKCQDMLRRIGEEEETEILFKETVGRAKKALKNNAPETAQMEIEALDKELRRRSEIISIQTQLTKMQKTSDAIDKVKQSYEEGNLESAEKQIMVLRRRTKGDDEVETLYKEIKSNIHFNKGVDHFKDGNIQEAKKSFKRVVSLDGQYADEASEYLQQIDDLKEQDQKAKHIYESALKHSDSRRFQEAHELLTQLEDLPSSVKRKVKTLTSSVSKKWRTQLLKQIRNCCKEKLYDNIPNLISQLKEVRHAEDSKIINEAYKEYHIYRAHSAEKRQNPRDAFAAWVEAQKYDAGDEIITNGLAAAKKEMALREANSASSNQEKIGILEAVVERGYAQLTDLDFKIEERLYDAYLSNQEFSRALGFAANRLNLDARFAEKAKTVRELCYQLIEANDSFDVGSFANSLDIIRQCRDAFHSFSQILQELYRKKKQKVIEILLDEARQLEIKQESDVLILAKYREVLEVQPEHRDAQRQCDALTSRFEQSISNTIQEAIIYLDEENTPLEDIDALIHRIHDLISIANDSQKTLLSPKLDALTAKRQTIKLLNKKLLQIEAFLNEAKETGDFKTVDRELTEVSNMASHRHRFYSRLLDRIQQVRATREQSLDKAEEIERAFRTMDYAGIEVKVDELCRLDPDDEFYIQRRQLKFEDPMTHQKIPFKELKHWASMRKQNFECIKNWFNVNAVDTTDFEKEEARLRKANTNPDSDISEISIDLERLAQKYREAVAPLHAPPEKPTGQLALEYVNKAEIMVSQLKNKANQLEKEANKLKHDKAKLDEIEETAGDLINKEKYDTAESIVEEGIELSRRYKRRNSILEYFRRLIRDEKK